MPLAKSKNAVGLGNSLMNDRFGKGKGADRKKVSAAGAGVVRTGVGGEQYVTNAPKEASWVKMRSVTEQAALDEFLSTAELAGTDFTAEKLNNIKIIHTDQKNPYLLSAQEERATVRRHDENKDSLTVPRRPPWDETTTPQELDKRERESLLEWRRGLATLQETSDLLMTPFERNLEVWRQLWRVIERSDLVVQIVDARNPLLFRSEDLESYVKEVDKRKNNLLLVNKADMMTPTQRDAWAEYFEEAGINYRFFSAALAKEANEAREDDLSDPEEEVRGEERKGADDVLAHEAKKVDLQDKQEEDSDSDSDSEEDLDEDSDERTRILTVDELEALFLEHAPAPAPQSQPSDAPPRKTVVGLVGYPNVGKSSTINALIGAKKVSVSATPGKTKHFQTIHLSPSVILCDCPGLVFPNFATTKAELVCSGVLPIDQLREFTGPAGLVARRIPRAFFEAVYGVHVDVRPLEEGGTGIPTAEEILSAYAVARGFATTGQGQPDASRAARYVLKDYVSGKLPFCHPPLTNPPVDAAVFNAELYDAAHLPEKRRAAAVLREAALAEGVPEEDASVDSVSGLEVGGGAKTKRLDKVFFGPTGRSAGHITRPFNYVYSQQGRAAAARIVAEVQEAGGKAPAGRKLRALVAMERGVAPEDLRGDKKHFKGPKRGKGKGATKAEEV